MKSINLFICFVLFSFLCSAQDLHQEVVSDDGKPFLLGPIKTTHLKTEPYQQWYDENFNTYQPDQASTKTLQEALDKYHVLLFLGTWCGDSRREVPRFMKILTESNFPEERVKIIAVDRRKPNVKKSPTGEEWGLQIKRVPTFIFLKDGKEVNRIVESPVESLEKDMLRILKQKKYEPNYAELMRSK